MKTYLIYFSILIFGIGCSNTIAPQPQNKVINDLTEQANLPQIHSGEVQEEKEAAPQKIVEEKIQKLEKPKKENYNKVKDLIVIKKEKEKVTPPEITTQVSQTGTSIKGESIIPAKEEAIIIAETPKKIRPNHQLWNDLLQENVTQSGKVNYHGFMEQRKELESYLNELSEKNPQSDWSKTEQMAYWINVYNAFTVKLIVDNHPIKSITELHNGKPWDVKWIRLGDKTYSLNNIENDILRPTYNDARIHFAVNCAAKSCPPLLNKAWTGDNLNQYLNQQAIAFINNGDYNQLQKQEVKISKIFEWYAQDFGQIIDYLNNFSKTEINSEAAVQYLEYDWGLND